MPRKSAASSPPLPWRGAPRPNRRTLAMPSPLLLWEKATRTMSGPAVRLRHGPQVRREKAKAPEKPLTWDERFRLEHYGRV